MRAAAGHPAPFNLRYMEIGNENGGFPGYVERWKLFYKAIKAKYPYIIFVANGWNDYGDCPADVVDDHYYSTPEWFIQHANQYDKTDRKGPKVFVGEYAVTQKCGKGNLRGAIGEAAFMTGLERNSDVVCMASYAPLLVNLNHRAWNPDLINFDSSKWYGLPSYYVQQLFSQNQGDRYLPTDVESPVVNPAVIGGKFGVGTWNTAAEYKDILVTSPDGKVLFKPDLAKGTNDWKMLGGGDWKVQDGALRQTAERSFIRALAGEKSWTDYTLTLKARKISGAEGFLILFHVSDEENHKWWNIGGWNNTQDAVEADSGPLDSKPIHVEMDRWYDIKLAVTDKRIKCWFDGKLIHDIETPVISPLASIYATSASDTKTGDIIVKVVNTAADPIKTELVLAGANLTGKGTAVVLTSANPEDENSLDEPTKVSTRTEAISLTGTTLDRSFAGNSFTVLRLQTRK
jgi:alpha-L-arabinofuranosidase